MTAADHIVYVVDDDPRVREAHMPDITDSISKSSWRRPVFGVAGKSKADEAVTESR